MKVHVHELTHFYEDKVVLDNINLDIENASAIALLGPSGAGKSTLLRLLSKIESPTSGSIMVNGIDVVKSEEKDYFKHIGFVFQHHGLFPHLSALANVTIVLEKVHNKDRKEAEQIARTLFEQFELSDHMHKKPAQLSGGQAQRVSIIRSLAASPEILFFDEPTSALDPILTKEVLHAILKLREQHRKFVIVTHEIAFARHVADVFVYMEEGKVIESGPIEQLDHPKSQELQRFLNFVMSF
jgi:ABC-type polar amino acid transport system ATPase subunit